MEDDRLPVAGADRHETNGTDGTTTEIDRRGYLKLAGGTAASLAALGGAGAAAGAEYETITLSRGEVRKEYLGDGESFENVLIDATADRCAYRLMVDGTDWTIRNVGLKGRITNGGAQEIFNLSTPEGGSGLVENVYLGDGATESGDWIPTFVSLEHAGTITIRNVHTAHWPNNGLYASAPGRGERDNGDGAVRIESSYARNNNIDGFRLGTDGSYLRNSVVHVDSDVPDVFGGAENARGVWIKDGGRVAIENCDILIDHPDGSYCIRQDDGKDGDDGVARVVDSEIATTIETRRFRGNVTTSNVGGDPDVTPPTGVPMSAEEAASGGDPADPEPEGPGLFTISNRAYDQPATYEFTVSGALEPTDSVNFESGDEISGSSAQGQVNGGSDTYRVAGAITDLRVDGSVDLSMDGEAVTADAPNRFAISDEGVGDPSEYRFTVSGALEATDSVNDNDELSGSSARGQVNGGTDAYRFGGGIERFVHDGPLTVLLNGRETDPASMLPHELRIQSTGDRATYEFGVSGDIQPGPAFDPDGTDELLDSGARGFVGGGGADNYYFSGDLTSFTRDGPLELYLDGERVDPDRFGLPHELRIADEGIGDPSEYRLTVSGALAPTDSVNDNDELSGSSARGQVNGGSDAYRFGGEITAFAVENPDETTVYLDGERVDPDRLGLSRSISISDEGVGDPSEYQFTVSGGLGATDSVNDNDEIDGSSARGQVNGGSDAYRFGGEITAFAVENPDETTVSVDGERVDPGQLGLPHSITISNRAYDTPATYRFEVSGDLGATDSVNFEDGDEISGSSAQGQVNGGSDTYRYSGDVTSFENDGPLDVSVDGTVVQSSSE